MTTGALASGAAKVVSQYLADRRGRNRGYASSAEVDSEIPVSVEAAIKHDLGDGRRPQMVQSVSSEVGAAALAIDADSVFRDARKRVARLLTINIALAIVLASILVIGLGGVVIAGIVLGRATATLVFGGMTFADVLALAFTRPFSVIGQTVVQGQRLDIAHLRLREQLRECDTYGSPSEKFECRTRAWDSIQAELRSLSDGAS